MISLPPRPTFCGGWPAFHIVHGDYNIKCAPTQSLRRYYLQFLCFLVSPGSSLPVFSARPSFATGSRLISSPCSRQKANQTGQAPRHLPKGPAARRTSPRWRSPASTCKKYAPRHMHRQEGARGHLLYSSATAEHSAVTPSSRKTRGWGGVFIFTGSPPCSMIQQTHFC